MTRRRVARRRIRHTFTAGAAAEAPPGFPPGAPVIPLRFPEGVTRLAAADFCGSVKCNGYYGDPPRPTSPVGI